VFTAEQCKQFYSGIRNDENLRTMTASETKKLYCPVCDESVDMKLNFHTFSDVFKKNYYLYQCTNCLTLATWPQLTDSEVSDYYSKEETVGADLYKKWKKKYRYQYRFVFDNCFPLPQRVLEVGSNTGNLLRYFSERGHKVYGLELSHNAAEYARKRNRVPTHVATIENYNKSHAYDIILAVHTFEHLKDPRGFLNECKRKLSENGFLFIDVPNGLRKSHELLGNSANMLSVPFHIYLYNHQSLRTILESEGFRHIATRTYSAREDNGPISKALALYWKAKFKEKTTNKYLASILSKTVKLIVRFYPIRKLIGWWYGTKGKSESFAIVAQKKDNASN